MKKILILSVAFVLVGAVAVLYLAITKQKEKTENATINLESKVQSEELPKIEVAAMPNPELFSPYAGDPIENIGQDPFIQQVPKDYLEKYKQELANFNNTLTENPGDAEAWVRVGVLKKFFNNYLGARDAWEYAKIVNPEFSIPYYNLGGLYAGYLKNNPKAEENYLKAIEVDPSSPYLYLGLAELYAVFYPEKANQAANVILRGLKANPDEPSLIQALENL